MEKILINLYVPSLGEKYDVYIPGILTVSEVVNLLIKAVEHLSDGAFRSNGEELLCMKNMVLMEGKRCIQDYGITNGEELLLI